MELNKPISTVIIFTVVVLLVFLFVAPKYRSAVALTSDLAKKQAEYASQEAYFASVSKIRSDIQKHQEVLEKIDSALPQESDLSPLVYFFQQNAAANGMVARSVVFSDVSSQSGASRQALPAKSAGNQEIKTITFSVDVWGNYQGLKGFLRSLEASARLFEVTTIAFASLNVNQVVQKSSNQPQMYDFKLEVKAHSY